MAKLGTKGYKGPVHEGVRKSPLGALVQTSKKKRYDTKLRAAQEKASRTSSAQRRQAAVQEKTWQTMQSHGFSYGEAAKTAEEAVRRNEMAAVYRQRAAAMKSSSGKTVRKPSKAKGKPAKAPKTTRNAPRKATPKTTRSAPRKSVPKKSAPKKSSPKKAASPAPSTPTPRPSANQGRTLYRGGR